MPEATDTLTLAEIVVLRQCATRAQDSVEVLVKAMERMIPLVLNGDTSGVIDEIRSSLERVNTIMGDAI